MTIMCNQHECDTPAVYRFTWPGKDEAGICQEHAPKLRSVAGAIGRRKKSEQAPGRAE